MKVFVLVRSDSWERTEILGVFATIEVAKTIAEAEEPGRKFDWTDQFGDWAAFPRMSTGPIYQYTIEEHEVRSQ